MAGRRIHIVVDEALLGRIDAARPKYMSRGAFVREALERALEAEGPHSRDRAARPETVLPPAPVRASEPFMVPPLKGVLTASPRFMCRSCDFTAQSPSARCPRHPGALVRA